MPSSHAPIKKYNYERSLFRWVMSRHPEPFEKHGITTRTLERAPLAREAFYTSDWPGARALVQSSDESKYERTAFFDAIIERGLRGCTRFNIDHVTNDEKNKLGITMDRASGKFYLAAYGSPRARRNSTRRGSQTSSEGEGTEHTQHAVVKEVEELLTAEIAAAGEHAEVILLKARTDPGSTRGSKTINFSVSIRQRRPGESVESGRERGEGHGAGPLPMAHTQTADAGGGKATNAPRSRGGVASQASDAGSRASRDGSSPKQTHRSDSSSANATQHTKSRGRSSLATLGSGLGEGSKGADEFSTQEASSKRRRSVTATVFAGAPRPGATTGMTPKHEPQPTIGGASGKVDMWFGRPSMAADASSGRVNSNVRSGDVPTSFLPGSVSAMSQAIMPQAHQLASASTGGQYCSGATSSPRGQAFSATGGGNFSGSIDCYQQQQQQQQQQRPGMATGNGQLPPTGGTGEGGGGGANGLGPVGSISTASSMSSWHLHATAAMRTDDFGAQLGARTTAGRGGGETVGVEVGGNTGGTTGLGSMSTLSQHQQHQHQHQHLSGSNTFGQRLSTAAMGRVSPTTMLAQESHSSISGLNAYSAHVRQQAHATTGGNHGGLGVNTRIGTSLGSGREPDEEDMDFLASFF